jgi:23S rRNA pseudouridine2605 synthase
MSVGRLDLNSEGLLLLTNDGELKRRLELPSTGWLRKYRVRVKGNPTDPDLEPLRKGITVEGERFQPMDVALDRIQGANAWLTVGLREGKNREIRRAMNAIGLTVNRLIRVSYGPFRLNDLEPGAVEEVRPRILRDQLGALMPDAPEGAAEPAPKLPVTRAPRAARQPEGAPAATPRARARPGAAARSAATSAAPRVFTSRRAAEAEDRADPPKSRPRGTMPDRAAPKGARPARGPAAPAGGKPRPPTGRKPR